jgi:uncharacterized protein YkwD
VEPPGGESGNIEHAWGMCNKPAGSSTPSFGAPHNNNNNNKNNNSFSKTQFEIMNTFTALKNLPPLHFSFIHFSLLPF